MLTCGAKRAGVHHIPVGEPEPEEPPMSQGISEGRETPLPGVVQAFLNPSLSVLLSLQ